MAMIGLNDEDKIPLLVSEVAFFVALYYFLYLLQVPANVLGATILLFVLINVSIFACPVIRNCCK